MEHEVALTEDVEIRTNQEDAENPITHIARVAYNTGKFLYRWCSHHK